MSQLPLTITKEPELPARGRRAIAATIRDVMATKAEIEVRHSRTNVGFYRVIGKRVNVRRGPSATYDTNHHYSIDSTLRTINEFLGQLLTDVLNAQDRYPHP